MNDVPRKTRSPGGSAWISWLLVAPFFTFVASPAIVQYSGLAARPASSGSVAAPTWPTSLADLTRIVPQMQAYFDEQFGLKSELVYLNSIVRYRMGVTPSASVALGEDNFLFYAYEPERLMEQHVGLDSFDERSLSEWLQRITENQAWLAERGIAFYVVVAPDKSTIYPEFLPQYPRLPGAKTRLDQVADALERRPDLAVIDPRASITALKAEYRVYPVADSHWGPRAAFAAYSLLIDRMRERFPAIQPVSLADYDIVRIPQKGDLAYLLNLYDVLIYPEDVFQFRGQSHVVNVEQATPDPSWGWLVSRVQTDRGDKPTILVQGDSFTDYVLGPLFLYQTFGRVIYTHHNGTRLNKALIEETHPDIVVLQLAERYLAIP